MCSQASACRAVANIDTSASSPDLTDLAEKPKGKMLVISEDLIFVGGLVMSFTGGHFSLERSVDFCTMPAHPVPGFGPDFRDLPGPSLNHFGPCPFACLVGRFRIRSDEPVDSWKKDTGEF